MSAVLRLREALSSLRATTSPEIVEGSRSRVRLAPNVTVDARELEALIRRLNADRAVLRAFAEPERLTVELLPGWKDRRIQLKRTELRLRAGYVLGEYIGEQIACGDLPAARRAIDVALDADPLDENAVRALIGIHRSAGDHDEAIRTYFRFRDLWFDTHGLEPTELEALFKWLVTRDPRTLEPRDREREP